MSEEKKAPTTADDPTGRKWTWEEDGYTVIRGNARTAPGCHDNCGVLMYVKDGKVHHVEGDPEDPYNQGRLCLRCLALTDYLYHEDRQLYPMKRARENRGLDKFERITWDEAYDICETEIKRVQAKHGKEAVCYLNGTGRDILIYGSMLAAFLGTPNAGMGFFPGQACYIPRTLSTNFKSGGLYEADYSQFFADRYDHPTWKRPDYVVIWGNNPVVANSDGTLGHWIVECMKRGTKLITIDPKLTWCAAHSEVFLQVRPGTDAALALAFAHVIIAEDLHDHEFVENWTYGFDEYKANVAEWTPARAAEICEVDEELVWEAARAIGNAEGWSLQWGVAMDHTAEGFYTGMAAWDLVGLTGMFDHPGGMVAGIPPLGCGFGWVPGVEDMSWIPKNPDAKPPISKPQYMALNVLGMYDSESLLESIESDEPDYPVKAFWAQGTNTLANIGAEPKRILDAVQKNSEFNVVVDMWMTPTALAFADVFLPVCCFPERIGITGHQPYRIGAIVKAVEPAGEAKSDQEIILEMGRRFMGEEVVPFKNEEEFYDFMLGRTGCGLSYNDMKKRAWAYPEIEYFRYKTGGLRGDGKPGFNTPTSLYEFNSTILGQIGIGALASYEEPVESPRSLPELAEKYPLILTTGARNWGYFHSEGRQIAHLRRVQPDPLVRIHPVDAAKYGIADGDWVLIENQYGSCRQRAEITPRIKQGVVSADHGWYFPERAWDDGTLFGTLESNINNLLPIRPGKTGVGNAYKSQICRIGKVVE